MNKEESKISNTEWGLVIGALLMIDLTQMVLEWLLIGFILNPFIDIFVGMSLALYLQLRGQSMASPKRLFALLGTFFGEMIPVVAELPLWTLDGIFNMVISKSDKILGQIPGGNLAVNAISGNKPTLSNQSAMSRGDRLAKNLSRTTALRYGLDQDKVAKETWRRNNPLHPTGPADQSMSPAERIADQANRTAALRYGLDPDKVAEEARRRNNPLHSIKPSEQSNNGRPSKKSSDQTTDKSTNADGKIDSMSIHDELWELNAKPNLSLEDKERLQKAYWIMEHNHIEDKEKDDPVLLRAFERASRGEVISDGSPEKRHGFKFSNVQIIYNVGNTIEGRDFASLNPQYGGNKKSNT